MLYPQSVGPGGASVSVGRRLYRPSATQRLLGETTPAAAR